MASGDVPHDVENLERLTREVRATCVQMAHDGGEGHLSSSLSQAGLLVALYHAWLRVDPADPARPDRDRFFLSKGHGCASLYAVLAQRGFLPREALREYNVEGGALPNHPCRHALPLLEASSGSLGQALGIATGALYALRLKGGSGRAAVLLGDGECNEGSVWEAAMFAAAHRLDRLLAVVDYNGIQAVGRSDDLTGHARLEEKFRAFGWAARAVDGTDMREIVSALDAVPFEAGKPSAIVARTRAGVSFMDGSVLWHYRKPDAAELEKALAELGERPLQLPREPAAPGRP